MLEGLYNNAASQFLPSIVTKLVNDSYGIKAVCGSFFSARTDTIQTIEIIFGWSERIHWKYFMVKLGISEDFPFVPSGDKCDINNSSVSIEYEMRI